MENLRYQNSMEESERWEVYFKGEERGKLKFAQNLIQKMALDDTTISQVTELDIDVIKKLRSDIQLKEI
ncbi:hypothetical protein BGP_4355 [Beggiatoa sp. PS]|nr:hypothetical protein BGP_4355 [Beggiatoa sp. PS]